jgi:hypothetical protein
MVFGSAYFFFATFFAAGFLAFGFAHAMEQILP